MNSVAYEDAHSSVLQGHCYAPMKKRDSVPARQRKVRPELSFNN